MLPHSEVLTQALWGLLNNKTTICSYFPMRRLKWMPNSDPCGAPWGTDLVPRPLSWATTSLCGRNRLLFSFPYFYLSHCEMKDAARHSV